VTRLVDPDAPVIIEMRGGKKFVPLPSRDEATQKVHATLKRVSDLPAPPDQSNPIAVVLSYELFGLSVDETALAMNVPIGVVNNIRASEGYSQFKGDVLENIRKTTSDVVTKKFEENAERAASRVIDLVDSPSGIVSLSAAKQVLDRSQGTRSTDPMRTGLQIVIYNTGGDKPATVIEGQSDGGH
jgi:hypothetical protein